MKPKSIAILFALAVFGIILLQNMQNVEIEMLTRYSRLRANAIFIRHFPSDVSYFSYQAVQ